MSILCSTSLMAMCLFSAPSLQAQEALSLDTMLAWVMREHPMARMARVVAERGPAQLLAARGAYDPTLKGSFDRKDYLGTEYFQYIQGGATWQSPYAVKVEAGREWADGVFFNPERTVPDAGQAYISVKLPLLQGLLNDKYRTDVEQGRNDVDRYRAAAEVIRNDLAFDASLAYAEWAFAKTRLAIFRDTEELLSIYLANTRELVALGDKAAVDTVEALVYLVDQELNTQQAAVDVNVAAQSLAAFYFLPFAARDPLDLSRAIVAPPDIVSVTNNPELERLRRDVVDFQLERVLKREYLKPQLDVGYSILGDGFELAPESSKVDDRNFFTRAYKVGAEFRYPLFNRSARGEVALAELKLAEAGAKLETKRQQLLAKAQAYRDAVAAYDAQLIDVERLIQQAENLLEAERELFALGETTQFLLNARAQSLQKARLTANKLAFARAKAILNWRQALGVWR